MGMNLLSASGTFMQGIENKGYAISFLIQDGLGMTLPRTITGFLRDREVTGEYNTKEGLEVFGREGMTGPFMIGVAPFMLWATGKFCNCAGTKTLLIKIVGQNFKTMLESPGFDTALKNDKEAFKNEFIKYNIKKFYKDTIPNDKNSDEAINYIVKEFDKLNSKDSKTVNRSYKNILNVLNEHLVSSSQELDSICKLSTVVNGEKHTFAAGDVVKAINSYANDAITNNKNVKDVDAKIAENIKNNLAARRLGFNIATVGTTLGGLSVLPKLYAYNSVAPGSQHLVDREKQEKSKNDITFKGGNINSKGFFTKIGDLLTKKIPNWIQREFEYNGYNFTPTLMACLSLFGLLLPRGLRAYDRALVDENGKKDMTEIHEILLRDTISSLGVVYTVPILQKSIVSFFENKKGYVLTNKASMNKSTFRKFIDAINPYSDLTLMSNTELQAIYDNINSKAKMVNFAKFIDAKGGDLQKILSESKNKNLIFNEKSFTLESIKDKDVKVKNKEIISLLEKLEDNETTKKAILKFMNDNGAQNSSITKIARGLSSVPGFISTVIISPFILGIIIPEITYANTRKTHAKTQQKQSETSVVA